MGAAVPIIALAVGAAGTVAQMSQQRSAARAQEAALSRQYLSEKQALEVANLQSRTAAEESARIAASQLNVNRVQGQLVQQQIQEQQLQSQLGQISARQQSAGVRFTAQTQAAELGQQMAMQQAQLYNNRLNEQRQVYDALNGAYYPINSGVLGQESLQRQIESVQRQAQGLQQDTRANMMADNRSIQEDSRAGDVARNLLLRGGNLAAGYIDQTAGFQQQLDTISFRLMSDQARLQQRRNRMSIMAAQAADQGRMSADMFAQTNRLEAVQANYEYQRSQIQRPSLLDGVGAVVQLAGQALPLLGRGGGGSRTGVAQAATYGGAYAAMGATGSTYRGAAALGAGMIPVPQPSSNYAAAAGGLMTSPIFRTPTTGAGAIGAGLIPR